MDKARKFSTPWACRLNGSVGSSLLRKWYCGFSKNFKRRNLKKAKSSTNPLYFELNWILLQGLICQRDASYTMKQPDLDKVADYLFQTEEWTMYELILFGNLYSFYEVDYVTRLGREVMEREDFYKEIGRHRKLVLILALNCYPALFRTPFFWKCQLFWSLCRKDYREEHQALQNAISFIISKGFALYQKGKQKRVAANAGSHAYFWRARTARRVAYYQEHFDKFVKMNVLNGTVIRRFYEPTCGPIN